MACHHRELNLHFSTDLLQDRVEQSDSQACQDRTDSPVTAGSEDCPGYPEPPGLWDDPDPQDPSGRQESRENPDSQVRPARGHNSVQNAVVESFALKIFPNDPLKVFRNDQDLFDSNHQGIGAEE